MDGGPGLYFYDLDSAYKAIPYALMNPDYDFHESWNNDEYEKPEKLSEGNLFFCELKQDSDKLLNDIFLHDVFEDTEELFSMLWLETGFDNYLASDEDSEHRFIELLACGHDKFTDYLDYAFEELDIHAFLKELYENQVYGPIGDKDFIQKFLPIMEKSGSFIAHHETEDKVERSINTKEFIVYDPERVSITKRLVVDSSFGKGSEPEIQL